MYLFHTNYSTKNFTMHRSHTCTHTQSKEHSWAHLVKVRIEIKTQTEVFPFLQLVWARLELYEPKLHLATSHSMQHQLVLSSGFGMLHQTLQAISSCTHTHTHTLRTRFLDSHSSSKHCSSLHSMLSSVYWLTLTRARCGGNLRQVAGTWG
jgi:hypothetical protein